MANKKQFVLEGAVVRCSNGTTPSTLTVTCNHSVYADGKKVATKMDVILRPPTFTICTPFAGTPGAACAFIPVPPWNKPHGKQKFTGIQPLLGGSTIKCGRPTPKGFGKITIVHDMQFLASKYNINPETLLCPKCNKPLSNKDHKCGDIPPGDYNGDGGKLGDGIMKRRDGSNMHYGGKFSNHPFYIEDKNIKGPNNRNGIEAHHLLSSSSIRQIKQYAALIRMLGYSINHRKNGLLIPTFMQTACAFGVPLHNGGHKATFILDKDISKDEEDIKTWVFNIADPEPMKVIFPSYDASNEIAKLNYEDHINEIVRNTCDGFILDDICNEKKRLEMAKSFINTMDEKSQVVFKKLSTFQWTLVSDGLDYTPGGIGCCSCTALKDKRIKIKESLTDVQLPSAVGEVKKFWSTILSSPDIVEKIKNKTYICTAAIKSAAGTEEHYKNNNSAYYQERQGIKDFEKFKEQK